MSRSRSSLVIGVALALAIVHVAQLIDFGFGRDQAIYALVADAIRHGGVPYVTVWDFKPPGIFFLYAAIQTMAAGPTAIRTFEAIAVASYVPAFIVLSRRFIGDGRAGLVAGALAIVCHTQLEFWHTAQPESFGGVVLAWLLVVATGERHTAAGAFMAGILTSLALLLKPTIGIAALPALVLPIRRAAHAQGLWKSLVWVAFGVAIPLAAMYGFFASRGGVAALRDSQLVFAPAYAAFSWAPHSANAALTLITLTWKALRLWLLGFSLPNLAGLVLFAALASRTERRDSALWVGMTLVALVAGVIVQGKFFAYHFGALLPLTALPAGWGFWLACVRSRGTARFAAVLAGLVFLVLINPHPPDLHSFVSRSVLRVQSWISTADKTATRDQLYSVADFDASANRAAADWVQRHVPLERALFIWGFSPNIYLASGRPPASRYVYNLAQRSPWVASRTRDALMNDLDRTKPDVILVEHDDRFAFLTGSGEDSAGEVVHFPAFATLLAQQYQHAATLRKFDVYRRVAR